jgi:hypothetical protein
MEFSLDLFMYALWNNSSFFPVTANLYHYILRSLALMATMTVLALMSIAPMAGLRSIP